MSENYRGRHRAPRRLPVAWSTTARVSTAIAVTGGLAATIGGPAEAAHATGTLRAPVQQAPSLAITGQQATGGVSQVSAARTSVSLPHVLLARDLAKKAEKAETTRATTARDTATRTAAARAAAAQQVTERRAERRAQQRAERRAEQRAEQRSSARQESTTQRRTSAYTARNASAASTQTRATTTKKVSRSATRTAASTAAPSTASSSNIVAIAKRYIGTPYSWGGSTPAGFDCSGFTSYVYKQAGKTLPHSSRAQRAATRSVSNPQPGDLVFFGSPVYHVGIYVGNGMMIDSSKPGTTISVRKIWSSNVHYGRL